jgi:hypothetical protein
VDDGGRPERHPDLIPRLRQIATILVFDLGGPPLSKLIPYVFAVVLYAWTLVYGEHEKKKAGRQASADART